MVVTRFAYHIISRSIRLTTGYRVADFIALGEIYMANRTVMRQTAYKKVLDLSHQKMTSLCMKYAMVKRNVEGDRCNMGHLDAFETVESSADVERITDMDNDKWNNVEVILKQYRSKPFVTRELDIEERYVAGESKKIALGKKAAMERRADFTFLGALNRKGDYTAVGDQTDGAEVNLSLLESLADKASAANWVRETGKHILWCNSTAFYRFKTINEVSNADFHERTWTGAQPYVIWDIFKITLNTELDNVKAAAGTTLAASASAGDQVGLKTPASQQLVFATESTSSVGFGVGKNWNYIVDFQPDLNGHWHMIEGRMGAKVRQETGVLRAVAKTS